MKVTRYVHLRSLQSKGGATVRIVGDTENIGTVDVQYVRCSRKDNYSKKEGRSLSEKAPIKTVPLRSLPAEISHINAKVVMQKNDPVSFSGYDYLFKYFLPKG